MKVHIVSLYTLVYIILGCKYKISVCNASGPLNLEVQERSDITSSSIQLVPLELDNRLTSKQFKYQHNGSNGNLYTAKGNYRFSSVTNDGQVVWTANDNEYPDRVYYEIRGDDNPLLRLIYSDEEFSIRKATVSKAGAVKFDQVRKTAAGQTYVQMPLPKSGDDRSSVRSGHSTVLKARPAQTRRAVPVSASHQTYAGQDYAECKMPRTDNEDAVSHVSQPGYVKVRASPVASSHAMPASKGRENYIQMPLPKSGTEQSSITPNMATAEICAPCVSRGQGYMQMPIPKTDNEGDNVSTRGTAGRPVINAQAARAFGKVARAPGGGFAVSRPSPVRTGVEGGQTFLEYKMPRTDNEGAGAGAGQDYLEFKLVSSGPEHGKDASAGSGALPKRKAILSPTYQDYAMPQSGETGAESEEFDIDNDPEIQALLAFIDEMKQKLATLREILREMDENDALRASAGAL